MIRSIKKIASLWHLIKVDVIMLCYKYFGGLNTMQFHFVNHFGSNILLQFSRGATVNLGKHLGIRNDVTLSVRKGAILSIGDKVFINKSCIFVAHNLISIGARTKFGPNVSIFDHDYDYKVPGGVSSNVFKTDSVEIGEDCWIGTGAIILKGTKIGNRCVIAAGTVVKGKYPDNSLILQKRMTEIKTIPYTC